MRTVTLLPVIEKTVAQEYDDTTKLGNWDHFRDPIDRVIIHTMVGFAQGADERFNDPTSNVSAHYGVLETGEIWHWVDETFTAYHAGNLLMNRRSIGIEHEDNGQPNSVRPDTLYTASANLVRDICQYYNIPIDRQHILKHSEVSDDPTSCPDSLDIDRIVSLAQNPQSDPLTQCRIDRDANWNMPQEAIQLLVVSVPANPTVEQKIQIGKDMVTAIQELIDYKNSHVQMGQPVQPNSNPSTQASSLPGLENAPVDQSQQSKPSNTQPSQTISPNMGYLIEDIKNFLNWILHRNEV